MTSPLPTMDLSDNPTGCCPRFHSEPWDKHDFSFEGLKFVKASTKSFFYIPRNMGPVFTATQKAIDAAGRQPQDRYLILSRDVSPWKCDHYFLVTGDVPGYETVPLPGVFRSRVFEGSYGQVSRWYKTMEQELKALGTKMQEVYAFYTTCPKCAKTYGKNYVVLLARTGS